MNGMHLMGGLCNMMFQMATARYLSWSFNTDFIYTNTDQQFKHLVENYAWEKHCYEYLSIFPNVEWNVGYKDEFCLIDKHIGFRYEPITPRNGDNYVGYFQSEKNFPNKNLVKEYFKPSHIIEERVDSYGIPFYGNTCMIHVRRGNYLSLQDRHNVLGMEYYTQAIWTMRPFNIDKFIVFSNDMKWCRENFTGDKFIFIEDIDYIELFAMAQCNHFIVANSSFSWWGAWLGETDNSVVIAPQTWFPNNEPDATDIVPLRWIKL